MTTPEDDVPLVEIGLRHVGDEYFVQARRPGAREHVEFGPMPEGATRPFIEGLKRSITNLGITGMAHQEANLKAAIAAATGEQAERFKPEEERKWLQRNKKL